MEFFAIIATLIFIFSFIAILSNKIHRTIVVWVGCIAMIVWGKYTNFLSEKDALSFIDFNVIGLLLGMMIIAAILEISGFFEFAAIKAAKISKGNPLLILIFLGTTTTVISLFVDNTTAILIMVPLTIKIADALKISAVPLLLAEAVLSNTGGVATLIGDPPNIMIGSAAGFSFTSFIIHLGPAVLFSWFFSLFYLMWFYKKWRKEKPPQSEIMKMNEWDAVKNKKMMYISLSILLFTILLFVLNDFFLHFAVATIALIGAGLALFFNLPDIDTVSKNIEWSVLLFFAGLFILVGSIEKIGILRWIGEGITNLSNGDITLTIILLLWISALASSVVDNIPFTAAMIPIINHLGEMGLATTPLFWALALGVGFGGNGTPIGSTAGMVTISLASKTKHAISTKEWLKGGTPIMLIACTLSTLFLLLFQKFFMSA
ncbi:MAG: ArsB/NhaD family transporter [Thermoplasmata archaeon]|nr:MAG: ArsB/NhaD family transporter [Thermoplasmata archaeon]